MRPTNSEAKLSCYMEQVPRGSHTEFKILRTGCGGTGFNPSTGEADTSGSPRVSGQCGLYSTLQDNLNYTETPYLKQNKT